MCMFRSFGGGSSVSRRWSARFFVSYLMRADSDNRESVTAVDHCCRLAMIQGGAMMKRLDLMNQT